MTIDRLIRQLEKAKQKLGGDAWVVVPWADEDFARVANITYYERRSAVILQGTKRDFLTSP